MKHSSFRSEFVYRFMGSEVLKRRLFYSVAVAIAALKNFLALLKVLLLMC